MISLLLAHAKDIWNVVGPLVGIFIGSSIAHRNDAKRWIAEKKLAEFVNILGGLDDFNVALGKRRESIPTDDELLAELQEFRKAVNTAIFTSESLQKTEALARINEATGTFRDTGDFEQYKRIHWDVVNAIVTDARKLKP
jgi:hypothetical protein